MLKEELRLKYILLRNSISPEALLNSSLEISNRLLELPIWSFDYYHIFLQISKKKEIDTSFILSILQGKDKNIVVPKIDGNNDLTNYLLTDSTIFKKNAWGIPEPTDGLEVPKNRIDVVFVPLLAFDTFGNRVGYGKGFYDNFLRDCRADILKIGLSLFMAEKKITDIHENDILLDFCITPKKIYEF